MFHALFFSSTKKPNLTIVKIGVFQLLKFRISRETFCYFGSFWASLVQMVVAKRLFRNLFHVQ